MSIFVCVYSHRHGEDIRTFQTLEKADAWKDEIGREYWNENYPDEPMPETDIGAAYFDRQLDSGEEWFIATECEVE